MGEVIRVLHVDDEPGVAAITAEYLEREDERFVVETVHDAKEALDYLAEDGADCIVSDYDMPERNGIEFLEAVRESRSHLPFILFTGKGSEELASDAIAAGVTDYLQKGTDTSQYAVLANRIENAVDQARSREKRNEYATILQALGDPIYILDAEGHLTFVNDALANLTGYPKSELLGEHVSLLLDEDGIERGVEATRTLLSSDGPGTVTYEQSVITANGERVPCEINTALLPLDAGDFQGTAGVVRDISARTQREQRLERLHDATRQFMTASTEEAVADAVIEAASGILGYPHVCVRRVTDDGTALYPFSMTDSVRERTGDRPVYPIGEGTAGRAFARQEPHVFENVSTIDDGYHRGDAAAAMYLPMAEEGTITILDDEPGVFDQSDVEIAQILAANAAVAFRRVDRRRELERYETILEALGDPVYAIDDEERYTFVNDAFVAETGYPHEAILGEHVSKILPESAIEGGRGVIRTLLEGDRSRETYEMERITADGERMHVENHVAVLPPAADGSFRGSAGVLRDISDRKKRERELERYERIVETMADSVFELDPDGYYTFVNDTLAELVGYEPDELIGRHASLLLDDADLETAERTIRDLLAGEDGRVGTYDVSVTTADGDTRKLEVRQTVLAGDEAFRGSVGTARDITERETRRRRIESLHGATRELVAADTDEEIAEITTKAAQETLGFPHVAVRLLTEDDERLYPAAISDRARAVAGERPIYEIGEGTAGRAFERKEPLLYEDVKEVGDEYDRGEGRAAMYLPIDGEGTISIWDTEPGVFDESDVELARILAANASVALKRVDQQHELERQNDRLKKFTNIVSHDLRSPLNVAMGRLELAAADCDSEHFEEAVRALDRMESLIENLLTLAQHGERTVDRESIALAAIVNRCWQNVETREAELLVDTERTIRADRSRLQQLFENLIRNAVEHSSTSSRTQSGDPVEHDSTSPPSHAREDAVEHQGESVTIAVGDLEDGAGFYVEDTGPGIPKTDRERAFESGYTTTENGTGFGLAIVREIVEAHGWEIRVTESEDGGARFEISGVGADERE